jgi:hypothetical protein
MPISFRGRGPASQIAFKFGAQAQNIPLTQNSVLDREGPCRSQKWSRRDEPPFGVVVAGEGIGTIGVIGPVGSGEAPQSRLWATASSFRGLPGHTSTPCLRGALEGTTAVKPAGTQTPDAEVRLLPPQPASQSLTHTESGRARNATKWRRFGRIVWCLLSRRGQAGSNASSSSCGGRCSDGAPNNAEPGKINRAVPGVSG